MNGFDQVDGLIFKKRHKSDNVDSPVRKRVRNGSGTWSIGSRNSTYGESFLEIYSIIFDFNTKLNFML